MNIILTHNGINLKQLSEELDISISTLSPHIKRLCSCGLIYLECAPASHGMQKCCYPEMKQILIDFTPQVNLTSVYHTEIPIGQYSDFQVTPTCGLATPSSFLGKLDEPRIFTHPERHKASILWFTTGYVEYILPNFIPRGNQIDQLTLTFEISSEAPQYNNCWPSDINFSLNGVSLGQWTCPGDFGGRRGSWNPSWWYDFLNQYGILKKLTISTDGTFLDGQKLSCITVRDLKLTDQTVLKFRFSVFPGKEHSNGLTIYGRGFGDHDQHIRLIIQYSPLPLQEK